MIIVKRIITFRVVIQQIRNQSQGLQKIIAIYLRGIRLMMAVIWDWTMGQMVITLQSLGQWLIRLVWLAMLVPVTTSMIMTGLTETISGSDPTNSESKQCPPLLTCTMLVWDGNQFNGVNI